MADYNSVHTGAAIDTAIKRIISTPGSGALTAADVGAAKSYKSIFLVGDNPRVGNSSIGWHRILSIPYNVSAYSILVNILQEYYSAGPGNVLVHVNFGIYNPAITILSGNFKQGAVTIDNLRLTTDSSNYYLDIHCAYNQVGSIGFDVVSSNCGFNPEATIKNEGMRLVDDSPAGETIQTQAEWVNPPMILGVEYRTAERWDGKPVYCIAWPGGAFPDNSTKNVEVDTGTPGPVTAIFSYVVLSNGSMVNGMYGTPQFTDGNYIGMFLQNDSTGGKFGVALGSKRTVGTNCTIFIKYIRG